MLKDIHAVKSELRVGESTIRRWIRDGRLPVVRLGRRVLVRPEDLSAFVETANNKK
ncbi:MAG: helix-turn-helix domain-containing protein [Nitrospiraceae bacterium]